MVHAALVSQVRVLALHPLIPVGSAGAEGAGTGLDKQRLGIGRHTDGLLPHRGRQAPEGLVPGFIFFSFPILILIVARHSNPLTLSPVPLRAREVR